MKMIHILQDGEFSIKKSTLKGAGMGLFSKTIRAGTIIPYNTIIKKYNEIPEEEDDTYYMGVSYIDDNGVTKSIRGYIADGNPSQKCFK